MISSKGAITGHINSKETLNGSIGYSTIELEPVTQEKAVIPSTEAQTITYDDGYTGLSKVNVEAVTSDIDSNIQPENIASGVDILGVTGTFETPYITDCSYLFYNKARIDYMEQLLNVCKDVTNTESMFYRCSSLTSLDLSNFDTSNVTDMAYMFYNCSNLTSLDLSSFDFFKVTSYTNMFRSCTALETVYVKDETAKEFVDARLSDAGLSITSTIKE